MRYSVIDDATQTVVNVILANPESLPDVSEGFSLDPNGGEIGQHKTGGKWSDPTPDADALASAARIQRAKLLAESDWTQVADAPVDKVAWVNYRQSLRNLTDQAEFPFRIDWPVPPST